MYSAKVTLSETATPSVSNLGGALWGAGVVSGSEPVTFSTSDPSGISQVALDGPDGQIALQPQSCELLANSTVPAAVFRSLELDTTQLHDGPQTLTLLVTNAAGNTTTVQSPTIVVDNNGPPAPSSLTATAVGGGSDAVDLSWSDPANPPQPVSGAFVQLCKRHVAPPSPSTAPGALRSHTGSGHLHDPTLGSSTKPAAEAPPTPRPPRLPSPSHPRQLRANPQRRNQP